MPDRERDNSKIIRYIHGLGSTANSHTVQLLRKYLPENFDVIAEDVDIRPQYAKRDVERYIMCDVIIGSSLGGFYAQEGHSRSKILINPALDPAPILKEKIGCGTYEYFDKRRDGIQTYTLDDRWFEELEEVHQQIDSDFERQYFHDEMYESTYIFLGRNDPLVLYKDIEPELKKHYNEEHIRFVDMEHRVSEGFVKDILAPFIRKLVDDNMKGRGL